MKNKAITTNWSEIMTKFINGNKLKDLAIEYGIPLETIKGRHRKEKWSKQRENYKRKRNENITNKLAVKASNKIVDEIEILDYTVKHLAQKLKDCPPNNAEGIGRAIAEVLKTKGLYTHKTIQKIDHSAQVKVIPIFGDLKLNVQSSDTNKNELLDRPNSTI